MLRKFPINKNKEVSKLSGNNKEKKQHLIRHWNRVKNKIIIKVLKMIIMMKAEKIPKRFMTMTQKTQNIGHMKITKVVMKKTVIII